MDIQPSPNHELPTLSSRKLSSLKPYLYRGKIGPALWNFASLVSLGVNLFLLVILLLVGRELFNLKKVVSDQLINGLYTNFVKMDDAHILATILVSDTIQVEDTIPVVFDLPLAQKTEVKLTQDTAVNNATIFLNGRAVPLNLVLRKGTALKIGLDLTVPVSQTIPVSLTVPVRMKVPVDIALDQTDLHQPFVGLQKVVSPYRELLGGLPDSWRETPVCGGLSGWLCTWFFQLR